MRMTITDPRVEANCGAWLLEVEGGRGALTRGAAGADSNEGPSITIQAFAALFSSAASARALAAAGVLAGASPDQLATLDALFAGAPPAMTDQF
jgi:predicted acetyltransferase